MRKRTQTQGEATSRAGRTKVRRPLRGLEVKNDTYATLRVIKANGESVPLVDAGSDEESGGNTKGYANFLLQSVSEARMEKHQIIETFGASYVFFFGESPRFLDVSAALLNTHDFNWEAEWWANYNMYLRGTKLVEMGARCYLAYDDNVVEGYLMQAQAVKTSDQHLMAQLQFRFFVTNCYNVSNIGSPQFPIRYSAQLPAGVSLTSGDAGQLLVSNLQGEPLSRAKGQGLNSRGNYAEAINERGAPGALRSISQLIREMPASFAVSPDWWPFLSSQDSGLLDLVQRTGNAIRGKIIDNTDEYVGTPVNGYGTANYVGYRALAQDRKPRGATQQEIEDIWRASTEYLSCFGADINNPRAYAGLGLSASFSASAGVGASFSPSVSSAYGFSGTTGVGMGAVAGGSAGVRTSVTSGTSSSAFSADASTSQFQMDSLGVVYGRKSQRSVRFSSRKQHVEEVGFDFNYGYESDYTSGPGYGRTGFGDMGGSGFGSGNSRGDPGYKSPDAFTFEGVAQEEAAFERFTRKREDRTAITAGSTVGRGDIAGGASTDVGGNLSAFALVSVEGELNILGEARAEAAYMSDNRAQIELGFGETLGGVSCPDPSLGGGLSVGLSFEASARAGVSVDAGTG